jgi:HAD superfamily hydrolase (TIGR01484 family)
LPNHIRLIALDIDGCLTPGEAQPWDFAALERLAAQNRQARLNPNEWAVTLCTGRPEPYVEAMMQAIDAHLPGIYENGGGMYFPSTFRFAEHPSITPARRAALAHVRRLLTRAIVEPGVGQFQPGKEVSFSLYPAAGVPLAQLAGIANRALSEQAEEFIVEDSISCIDIQLRGIDKGAGIEWLARETGLALTQIAGIGDALGDLAFLSRVGFSAAPANAAPEVQRAVQYVSPFRDSRGVLDIADWMIAHQL